MEIVPKWPRNAGTWLHEIESHYLNFHQYCVRDSLFIPLGQLCLKLSLWDVWTHQVRIMLTSPRGTQRGLVFILDSLWCSGMITAVSHHPILSCLDTRVTSGLLCSCHSQMHSGDTFNILEHLDSGILPFLNCIQFSLNACPDRTFLQLSFSQWLFRIIVVFPRFLNIA